MNIITPLICLILALLPLLVEAQEVQKQVLVHFHEMDYYHHHHNDYENDARENQIILEIESYERSYVQTLDHDENWYRFFIDVSDYQESFDAILRIRDQNKVIHIPAGNSPLYIGVQSYALFPYEVREFTTQDVVQTIAPQKTRIEGTLPIVEGKQTKYPQRVDVLMPFLDFANLSNKYTATPEPTIDWREAKFELNISHLFSTIAFVQLENRYFPLMLEAGDHYEIHWEQQEDGLLGIEAEKHHHHRNLTQDFFNERYPNGLNAGDYLALINALTGDRQHRVDSLIAWSRAIVPYFEAHHRNPERLLTHINKIGNFSNEDLFEEAFDHTVSIQRARNYYAFENFQEHLLGILFFSLFLFVVAAFLRMSGSKFVQTKHLKWLERITHATIWILLMSVVVVSTSHSHLFIHGPVNWLLFMALILVFYANLQYLIPTFLLRKRFGRYFIGLIVVSGLYIIFVGLQEINPFSGYKLALLDGEWTWTGNGLQFHGGPRPQDFIGVMLFVHVIAPIYGLGRHILTKRVPRLQRQKAALNAELTSLKTQLSPHFFFNSLNTVYGFALSGDSPRTVEAISKLSDLMRFALYQGDQDLIPLETELDYLADYIELQRLRLDPVKHELKFQIEGEPNALKIAPLMLITLIENAFKHGISMSHESYIYIDLMIQERGLILTVENSVHQLQFEPAVEGLELPKAGGLGLLNTQKRLDLLYGGKYDWQTESRTDCYYTQLSLELA